MRNARYCFRSIGLQTAELLGTVEPLIPSKAHEVRSQRPVEFDDEAYRQRNIVERLIGWLKEARRIFARFEKTALNFGGFVKMAFIERYLRLATDE